MKIQNSAARLLTLSKIYDHISPILRLLYWLQVDKRIVFKIILLVHHSMYGASPVYLQDSIPKYNPARHLRSSSDTLLLNILRTKHYFGYQAFSVIGPKLWNELPIQLHQQSSMETFKSQLKTYLFVSS